MDPQNAVDQFLLDNLEESVILEKQTALRHKVDEFLERNKGKRLAFVTSGGTTVPLERHAVRHLTNFSRGGRGSALTEHLLEEEFTVICATKLGSMQPFTPHVSVADLMARVRDEATFAPPSSSEEAEAIEQQSQEQQQQQQQPQEQGAVKSPQSQLSSFSSISAQHSPMTLTLPHAGDLYRLVDLAHRSVPRFLSIPFETVVDYMLVTKVVCQALSDHTWHRPMIILAAAVSDYYLPAKDMATHKLSGGNGLTLQFANVPKALGILKKEWLAGTQKALLVTFKLETHPEELIRKARHNITAYGLEIVVANLLQTYRTEVQLVRSKTSNSSGSSSDTSEWPAPDIISAREEQLERFLTVALIKEFERGV